MQTTAMHGKFIWCELMTADVDAAGRFYSSLTGWRVQELPMNGGPSYHVFEAGDGEKRLAVGGMMVFPRELEGRLPPNWTGYVAVDDVDETAKTFEAAGGVVQRAPEDIPDVGRFAVVADPQGAVLCIMTPIPPQNPPTVLQPGASGTVGWNELHADDAEEALEFYANVFGWKKHHEVDMGPMGVYYVFALNEVPLGGIMKKPSGASGACWRYYFVVEGLDAAMRRIKALQGELLSEPMPVPGGSWILHARDPQGAWFALTSSQR